MGGRLPWWYRFSLFLGIVFNAAAFNTARAQIGGSTEIITGRVTGVDSSALIGAGVEITSVATGIVRRTRTGSNGRFTMLFRDGGGQYRGVVTYIGYQPASFTLTRVADEDRLVVLVRMSHTLQQLSSVDVRARAGHPAPRAADNGGTGRELPLPLLERLPTDPGDLEAVALLAAGVVSTPGTDSSRASFSVAGQPATQNNITIDGLSFLFGNVPRDAVRSSGVSTNSYDVSRGQFTGGQIAATTKSGSSLFTGTARYTGRIPQLQFAGSPYEAFLQKYSQNILSAGAGGPMGRSDRVFYYVAGEFERRTDDAVNLLDARPATLAKLGASADSVTRLLNILNDIGLDPRRRTAQARTNTTGSAIARLDAEVGDVHSLMLRGDFRRSEQSGGWTGPLATPMSGGSSRSAGGGMMASLTSVLPGSLVNEARAYVTWNQQRAEADERAPSGLVSVNSALSDGRDGLALFQFGGNAALPRSTRLKLIEAGDELSWLSVSGAHRLKLGVLVNRERSASTSIPSRYGAFVFNSLADLSAGRPSLYARTISPAERLAGSDNAYVYLGDEWRRSASLQLSYGLRVEGTRIPDAPAENPAIETLFGRRTSKFPSEVRASPRLGFTYFINNVAGISSGWVRGGIGEFRGKVPSPIVGLAATNTGLSGSAQQLVCVGDEVPTPDWRAYIDDTAGIPTSCASGATSGVIVPRPSVTLLESNFGAPRVTRASLGFGRRAFGRLSIWMDGLIAYGTNAPQATDLNLVSAPIAALDASEGSRPLYSPSPTIVPSTGATPLQANRLHPELGTVFAVGSGARSKTGQITIQLAYPVRLGYFNLSYSWTRALDQTSGFPFANSVATTAGDPRRVEWGTSDLERRHALSTVLLVPLPHFVELALIGRATSGPRFTPTVSGDVNADGMRNDRAFVFDPEAAARLGDTAVSQGMQRLLSGADSRTRECLHAQLARIASRNSCTTPWTLGFDMRANFHPNALGQRLTVSLMALNTLTGLDALLHAGSRLHGWGQPVLPDPTLLDVRGFDPEARRFVYSVNQHFGSPSGAANPFLSPFRLGVELRLALGSDAQREAMKHGTAPDGTGPSIAAIKQRMKEQLPNPLQMTLDAADSLQLSLTPEETRRLQELSESYVVRTDTIIGILATVIGKAGPRPDVGALAPKISGPQIELVTAVQQATLDLRATLSPDQWARLPDTIRFPLQTPPEQRRAKPSRQ